MLILLFVSIFTALSGHIFIAWGLWIFLAIVASRYNERRQSWHDYRDLRNEYMRTYIRNNRHW
jgi:hypothetical protein